MQPYDTLDFRIDDRGVGWLMLNRPDRKNAISARMMDELSDFAAMAPGVDGLRCVVMTGAEGTFCAGGDLNWMMTQIQSDRAGRMAEAHRLAGMLRALNEMPLPLVGRIEGVAMGGGVGLACVCDVAVAARDCKFGFTETRLGIIPATISPYVLSRMGEGNARRVFMSSRIFDGDEAKALGIVAQAVDPSELDAAIETEVAPYLKVPRGAVGRAKALARSLGARIDDSVIAGTIERLADAWETEEAREGIAAFLEKRRPSWN